MLRDIPAFLTRDREGARNGIPLQTRIITMEGQNILEEIEIIIKSTSYQKLLSAIINYRKALL